MKRWLLIISGVVVAGLVGLVVLSLVLVGRPYSIVSRSMLPLLKPEDVVFCSGDDARELTYGDIVVYTNPKDEAQGSKMLHMAVGFGGDTIQVKGGGLWINGEAVASRRVGEFEIPDSNGRKVPRFEETLPGDVKSLVLIQDPESRVNNTASIAVPANHVFVIGSFRDNSTDSRIMSAHGLVPIENIICKLELPEGS